MNEIATQITVEEQRGQLVNLQGENVMKEAEFRANGEKLLLAVYEQMEPAAVLAQAMLHLGKNAAQIGTLTITPDILSSLLNGHQGKNVAGAPHAG